MNCLVELYSLDVQKSFEKVVMSVGQLNAILRLASKIKEKVCIKGLFGTAPASDFFLELVEQVITSSRNLWS
jgi:hypothetical protein